MTRLREPISIPRWLYWAYILTYIGFLVLLGLRIFGV